MNLELNSKKWFHVLYDIRFWIVFSFLIRLYGITNPPLDPASSWRQVDVLMIARNFYEIDSNILYPRVDLSDSPNGSIVGSEFPIYNYLIFLLSKIFGYENWYGRIINLVITSVAVIYFHRIMRRFYGEIPSFNASLLFLFSGWFSYSRITIPDVFAASVCIISLYFIFKYFQDGRFADIVLFTSLAMIGCLSKISSTSLLTVLLLPVLDKNIEMNRKIWFFLSSAVILGSVVFWYFYWVPYLGSIGFPNYFFMGRPISDGILDIVDTPLKFIDPLFIDALKYTGFALLIYSIYIAINKKKYKPVIVFLISFLTFGLFILKSGKWFYINAYYFLMLVPAITSMAGYGLSLFGNRKVQLILLIIICVESVGNQIHVFSIREPYKSYSVLEKILDNIGVKPDDVLAIANDAGTPVPIYMSHRKGWNYNNKFFEDEENIKYLKSKNIKFILIQKKIYSKDFILPYDLLYDSEVFRIYKL